MLKANKRKLTDRAAELVKSSFSKLGHLCTLNFPVLVNRYFNKLLMLIVLALNKEVCYLL